MPSWILWLSPVVVLPALTVLLLSWTGRARGPVAVSESVEQYDRFRRAMGTPVPTPRTGPGATTRR